jgi:hypothetical protein
MSENEELMSFRDQVHIAVDAMMHDLGSGAKSTAMFNEVPCRGPDGVETMEKFGIIMAIAEDAQALEILADNATTKTDRTICPDGGIIESDPAEKN